MWNGTFRFFRELPLRDTSFWVEEKRMLLFRFRFQIIAKTNRFG